MDYKLELIKSIKGEATLNSSLMYSKLSRNLKLDKDIALSAITSNILSITHLPKKLRNDKEFVKQIAQEMSKLG